MTQKMRVAGESIVGFSILMNNKNTNVSIEKDKREKLALMVYWYSHMQCLGKILLFILFLKETDCMPS